MEAILVSFFLAGPVDVQAIQANHTTELFDSEGRSRTLTRRGWFGNALWFIVDELIDRL